MSRISLNAETRTIILQGLADAEEGKIQYQTVEMWFEILLETPEQISEELPTWLAETPSGVISDFHPEAEKVAGEPLPEKLPDWLEILDREKVDFPLVQESEPSSIPDDETLPREPIVLCERAFSTLEPIETQKQRNYVIGMSDDFIRTIHKIDAKLRGRILDAISDLSRTPNSIHGDTRRPLFHGLHGLWRYRIGDYRLIYETDEDKHRVTLLAFASRGDIYE